MSARPVLHQEHPAGFVSVLEMLTSHFQSRPKALAILAGRKRITYAQLGSAADRIARMLVAAGLRPGDVVAICVPPSHEFVAAALAAMSVGAAYLPIDENCPDERLAFMVEDSGARVLITTAQMNAVESLRKSVPVIEIDRVDNAYPGKFWIRDRLEPEQCAYLIYTSGSTGPTRRASKSRTGVSRIWLVGTIEPSASALRIQRARLRV
jgi:non-ribosomal peptide synthetase component F